MENRSLFGKIVTLFIIFVILSVGLSVIGTLIGWGFKILFPVVIIMAIITLLRKTFNKNSYFK